MAKWPYRKSEEELKQLTSLLDFQHFCIDDDPFAQLVLHNHLHINKILPDELEDMLYGYKGVKQTTTGSSLVYIFLTLEEHSKMQDILQNSSEPCRIKSDDSKG